MRQRGGRGRVMVPPIGCLVILVSALSNAHSAAASAAPATRSASVAGLSVSVAYAENIPNSPAAPAAFPVPWAGAPNTLFLGNPNPMTSECGSFTTTCYDAGGIRLDNGGSASVTVTGVVVDVHSSVAGGKLYNNLWGAFTVPAGKSVILTENPPAHDPGFDNFDSSDTPHGGCTPASIAPTVKLTIGGTSTTLVDSTHVLDTGGIDSGGCKPVHNESIQWRQIGATGGTNASVALGPATATHFAGDSASLTATVTDGSGFGLPNATVNYAINSGPNAGQSGSAVSDSGGHATFTYRGNGQGEDVVVASVASVGSFQSAPARVMWTGDSAAAWTGADVGGPSAAGGQSLDSATGRWTVSGAGAGAGGSSDQLHLLSQNAPPGGGIAARVTPPTGGSSAAGVMLRASADPSSPFYAALVTSSGGVTITDRAVQGGATDMLTHPDGATSAFVWLVAAGTTLSAYTSVDGYFWQPVAGATVTLNLGANPVAGMLVSSGSSAQLSTATFDSVAVTATPPPAQPPVPCPAPWTCADIGGPAAAGSASVMNGTTWTIQGSGGDIHGSADQFQFDWRSLPGDGGISARVTAQTNTNAWAKAGVMLRATSDPGAANYALMVTPGNGIEVQYRPSQGGTTTRVATLAGTVPAFLRVARTGAVFAAYTSADGVSWTLVPKSTVTLSAFPGAALQGLAVTSHSNGSLCTVTMDGVQPG